MTTAVATKKPVSQLEKLGKWLDVDPKQILEVLNSTAFYQGQKGTPLNAQELQAAIIIANNYQLDPFLKQIHVMRSKGRLLVIVGIDGWLKIIHSHDDLVSVTHDYIVDDGTLVAIECTVVRAATETLPERTFKAREYMAECVRDTEPWIKSPSRMLKHKATIQCARYAYALMSVIDDDDAGRIQADIEVEPRKAPAPTPVPLPKPEKQEAEEAPAGPEKEEVKA